MGTSRESFNIFQDIKYKKWKKVKRSLLDLLLFWKKSYNRGLVVKDTFITPFNKKIGCKMFGHRWCSEEEIERYDLDDQFICWKCFKREDKTTRKSNSREDKIDKILN